MMARRYGLPAIVTGLVVMALTASVLVYRDSGRGQAQQLGYMYSAKFLCGTIPEPPPGVAPEPLAPGDYATSILVHNFNPTTITVFKKMVLAPREPQTGVPSQLTPFQIPPDGAFEVDCVDVGVLSGGSFPPPPTTFAKGFAVIWSLGDFDVEVVLSTRRLAPGGVGMSFDNERLTSQRVEMPQQGCPGFPNDVDCDGFQDPAAVIHQGPANTNPLVDNCPTVYNPAQTNTDGNFIDLTPPKANDDITWINSDPLGDACDSDDDQDGLADTTETPGPPCATASAATNPLLRDTDGDRRLDGPECALGSDPALFTSVPGAGCSSAAPPDTDGDGVRDQIEACYYNSSSVSTTTDGTTEFPLSSPPPGPLVAHCSDGREVANVDNNRTINAADLGLVASAFGAYPTPYLGGSEWRWNMDFDKNGTVNAADLGAVAAKFGACP